MLKGKCKLNLRTGKLKLLPKTVILALDARIQGFSSIANPGFSGQARE